MLNLTNVSAWYGEIQVLHNVCLEVRAGEIVTLIGANAAGKSTMVGCISRTLRTFTGEIEFEGERIEHLRPDQIVDAGLIQVPEGRLLFPKLSVRENLEMGAYSARSRKGRKQRLELVYDILPRLKDRERQLAGTLSGGEAQMCAIGRGLMAHPKLIMFDEPSLGLAPKVVTQIIELIGRIRQQGISVLLIEQNIRQSLRIAQRAYAMENGKIILHGTGPELLESDAVKKAYLGL